jgi:hypothetical protein
MISIAFQDSANVTVTTQILAAYELRKCTAKTLQPVQAQCYDLLQAASFLRFKSRIAMNIGIEEIVERRIWASIFAAMSIALIIISFTVKPSGFPRGARWVIIVPSSMMLLNFLQIRYKFCVLYGSLALSRTQGWGFYGMRREQNVYVQELCVRSNYRRRVLVYCVLSLIFGVVVAGITYGIPANI